MLSLSSDGLLIQSREETHVSQLSLVSLWVNCSFSLIVYAIASNRLSVRSAKTVERLLKDLVRIAFCLTKLPMQILCHFDERMFAIVALADAAVVGVFALWAEETDQNPEAQPSRQIFLQLER
jgi:hypothetical protein